MATARVFKSGGSQAVRLPKEFRFASDEVEIFRRGDEVVLREKPQNLARVFDLITSLSDDFSHRSQRYPTAEATWALMPQYLLDTNVVIHIRQRHPASVVRRLEQLGPGEVALSAITYGELIYGAEKSIRREWNLSVIARLIAMIPILPLPKEAGDVYGMLRSTLERAGKVIGNNDLWIAAHAITAGLILVTNNEREFRRVSGLTIEDWTR